MSIFRQSQTGSVSATGGLFQKTFMLLTGTMLLSALGTWLGAGITSTAAIIVLAIAFFGGAIVTRIVAAGDNVPLALVLLAAWTFISGLFLGPCIHQYVKILGWETVFMAYLGTAGVMAGCGVVATFSGFNFSNWGRYLMLALFGLIIAGIVNIFVSFGTVGTMLYAGIGMVVFAGFFLFDFFRLAKEQDTWENAIDLAMNLYLDYINFLLYLLRFLAALFGKSSNDD